MIDDSPPQTPPQSPPSDSPKKKLASLQQEVERDSLLKAIQTFELENKTLRGQVESASDDIIESLKKKNKELKTRLLQVERELATEIIHSKKIRDANALADRFHAVKITVLEFCAERKLSPSLWKKLESL